jgi:hypothetical protein
MDELKFTGNALKGSRPILSFDQAFDSAPHYQLMKELFIQVSNVKISKFQNAKTNPSFDLFFSSLL